MGLTFIEWLRMMKQIDKKHVCRFEPVQMKSIKSPIIQIRHGESLAEFENRIKYMLKTN